MGFDIEGLANEAEKLAKEHPDQARNALDEAEGMLNKETGGKFADQLKSGEDQVEQHLGVNQPGQ